MPCDTFSLDLDPFRPCVKHLLKHIIKQLLYSHALFKLVLPDHLQSIGLSALPRRDDTPFKIFLCPVNESASVSLFMHQAKGISRTPPDSHCCNWVVAISTTVPTEALGNSHTTKALFHSTFHMMSGAQLHQVRKSDLSEKGGEITGSMRRKKSVRVFM